MTDAFAALIAAFLVSSEITRPEKNKQRGKLKKAVSPGLSTGQRSSCNDGGRYIITEAEVQVSPFLFVNIYAPNNAVFFYKFFFIS